MSADQITYLLIHGAGGTKSKWRALAPLLGDRVKAIDLPGHGASNLPVMSSIVSYAEALAEGVQGDKVVIIGHSMGGLVGIELAARCPNIEGLVLAASHYKLPVHPKILEDLQKGTFPESLFYASYSREADKDLLQQEKQEIACNPIQAVHSDFACCSTYDGEKTLASISMPILALYGAEDRLLPRGSEEAIQRVNNGVNPAFVDHAGHYVMLERPEETAKIILEFAKTL
ncbi:alpha/beta hydrolase [Aneurinibacillus sp. Ricciae_BoGa-3]|uniref:alpha/beta fold hydrolase n=1 Tax=Aneurinibacillus sp. Ricciae_BoGa-3 TaxID=3022697 RepID=UPI00234011F1|nr:alpha/beta hydrolase [Aneurinibacillus sp. Ricciae_BoGa-3]WCK55574.1 alpha/beta hydrolase [Aneurinibacillus sp. Ricciae_BoGa-3]